MNKAEKIDQLTPYQLEFPKEALPEIFVKDALTSDERMWVPQSENRSKILDSKPSQLHLF